MGHPGNRMQRSFAALRMTMLIEKRVYLYQSVPLQWVTCSTCLSRAPSLKKDANSLNPEAQI
jgi:hypothetical protein